MAMTEVYVDPSINADSGSGTVGDPYGDLQYALDQTTHGGDGFRFNIKAGTDEVLAAALSLTTHGSPTSDAPLVFEGYTSTAGDGGEGGISGGGSFAILSNSSISYLTFRNLHLHNCVASIVTCDNGCVFDNCRCDNCSTAGLVMDNYCSVINCQFTNITGTVVEVEVMSTIEGCYFKNHASNKPTRCILLSNAGEARGNIFSLDGATIGVDISQIGCRVVHNTFYGAAGTGTAIRFDANNHPHAVVHSNVASGFSGTGGKGIDFGSTTIPANVYSHNTFYDCETVEANVGAGTEQSDTGNETATVQPLALSGSDTFANRATYFAPVDTDSVFGGALGNAGRDRGAVQHVAEGGEGGGLLVHPGMGGRING